MNYLLNIHTATENAMVVMSRNEEIIAVESNDNPRQHAAFLHAAIEKIVTDANCSMQEITAVGVTVGPGSYTGIRVGLAAAKGICFALNIPLVTCNTLEIMALTLQMAHPVEVGNYCPMIDARRIEVFTAVYNAQLLEIQAPAPKILDETYVNQLNRKENWIFSGNGCEKLEKIFFEKNAVFFPKLEIFPEALVKMMSGKYDGKRYESLLQAEALYLKEFYIK